MKTILIGGVIADAPLLAKTIKNIRWGIVKAKMRRKLITKYRR